MTPEVEGRRVESAPAIHDAQLTLDSSVCETCHHAERLIEPGEIRAVTVTPQEYFRAEKAMAPSDCRNFEVQSACVGARVQFIVPRTIQQVLEHIRADAGDDLRDRFDTCPPGLRITFWVKNVGDAPAQFQLMLFGSGLPAHAVEIDARA